MIRRFFVLTLVALPVCTAVGQKAAPVLNVGPGVVIPAKSGAILPPPQNLQATISGLTVELSWDAPTPVAGERTEVEPNNRVNQLDPIFGPSPASVIGVAQVSDVGQISVGSTSDNTFDDFEDLFELELTASGGDMTLTGLSQDCDLFLISDASGTLQTVDASFNIGTASERIELANVAPGRYIVAVSIFDPGQAGQASTYRLTVNAAISEESLAGYRVYRSTAADAVSSGAAVAEVAAGTATASDTVPTGGAYFYQVTALSANGESVPSNEVETLVSTAVEHELPVAAHLEQNWPNPFNPSTRIGFSLRQGGVVRLDILDLLGRRVDTPVNGWVPAGVHEISWTPKALPTGSYIYRISSDGWTVSRMMMYLR